MLPFAQLLAALEDIRDPRRGQGKRYTLPHMLLFAVSWRSWQVQPPTKASSRSSACTVSAGTRPTEPASAAHRLSTPCATSSWRSTQPISRLPSVLTLVACTTRLLGRGPTHSGLGREDPAT